MSHFVDCHTEFGDPQALVGALNECGFAAEHIEVHQDSAPFYGYPGDVRPQQAHIVIHRQHVDTGSNDVGWENQPDGTYRAWISEFDAGVGPYAHRQDTARFNLEMQNRIKKEYACQVTARQQRDRGRSVTREQLPSGEIEMVIKEYRRLRQ